MLPDLHLTRSGNTCLTVDIKYLYRCIVVEIDKMLKPSEPISIIYPFTYIP